MTKIDTKCLIIGGGPAGYTAAIYASRANINPLLYEGPQPGGQLITTTEVENFPGYPEGVTGSDLVDDCRKQALKFGADIRQGIIKKIDYSKRPFEVTVDGDTTVCAEALIIATGATARYLGLPDEQKYMGLGVSACATCDGFFYRKRRVAVVGGGDTACEEALYLSNIATDVYLIVRKDYLRASKVMQRRVMEKENIHVLFNTNTVGLYGEEVLEGAHLVENLGSADEKRITLPIDGFFLAIGHKPNVELLEGKAELTPEGYIKTFNNTTATSITGVFAAGDVADPIYRQAITAAASGCKAAIDVERFLAEQD